MHSGKKRAKNIAHYCTTWPLKTEITSPQYIKVCALKTPLISFYKSMPRKEKYIAIGKDKHRFH